MYNLNWLQVCFPGEYFHGSNVINLLNLLYSLWHLLAMLNLYQAGAPLTLPLWQHKGLG